MPHDHGTEVPRDFVGGVFSSEVTTILNLGYRHCENWDATVFFSTWPLDQNVTWLFWCGPFILSDNLAKIGGHRPCENGNITCFICHVTASSKYRLTLYVGSLILSYYPAKFGGHRACESGNITFFICHVTTWLCWWTHYILSHYPAKFGGHRPYRRGGNGVYNISSSSNSNSDAEVYKWLFDLPFSL